MATLFDPFDPLTGERKYQSDHVINSAQFYGAPLNNPLSQNDTSRNRELHYAFLEETNNDSSLQSRISSALKAAKINASPIKLFEAINGFTISISPAEAVRLEAMPTIRSIEADRPLPLTPPVEVTPETNNSSDESSFLSENNSAQGWREIDRAVSLDQYYVNTKTSASREEESSTNGASAAALPIYNNGSASTGEILPYGVKAVWGGSDISTKGNAGSGTYAFVIDSGVLDTTGDLNVNKTWSKSWVSGESAFTDGNGHGTHVAGTIAALANGVGVVGVAPGAEVISLKVFNSAGEGASYSTIIEAVNYATQVINNNGLDKSKVVINMSLGGGYSAGMDAAVKNAANQGIKFSIAAGNSGADADDYSPASAGDHANVYTVSAVDNQYQMAYFSNWDDQSGGDDVDVAAPGVSVLSYYKGGQLAKLSGTSMAAPHVAGLLLMGGVKEGDMVTANSAGETDPFALIQSDDQTEIPEDRELTYSSEYFGDANLDSNNINISNGSNSLDQQSLEAELGLEEGILDTSLNNTKNPYNAVEGSAFKAEGLAIAGDTISFSYTFNTYDFLPYADFSFYTINESVFSLATVGEDTPEGGSKQGKFNYTFTNKDWEQFKAGNFSFSLGVMDVRDNKYDSFLTVKDFKITRAVEPTDDGDAAFSIAGSPVVGQTLSIQQDASDPDGDGSFTHTWQSSSNGNTWNDIQTSDQLRLDQSLEGKNLRILTSYTDAQGFKESLLSSSVSIAYSNDGDAAFSIAGSPVVGQTLSIQQDASDPDGDGSFTHTWQSSSNGNTWNDIQTSDQLRLDQSLEGKNLRILTSYTDAQGFKESLLSSSVSIAYSNDGDAAFSIAGSPIVGQTLSIQQDASDPDGDGSFTHTWQSSSNGNTWNDIQTSDQLRLDQSLEGKNLRILTSYTDAQGFKETVQSDIVSIRNEQDSAPTTFAEYGSLTINHNWKKIELTGTYDNAVVIASDPTFFGGDPTTVRLRNIDSNSFEIRLQEPNYKDGNHTYETISFLVVEEGSWKLQDGTMISAGSKSTNKLSSSEHESVSFEADFTSLPALFTQVQTYKGGDWVTTRTSNITQDSFSVAMQEEEKLNRGGHVTETIGWAAIDIGMANVGDIIIEGGITSNKFTHQTNSHQFINSFSTSPTLLTKLTTYDGPDTANSRITSLNRFGFGAIVQEEKSADNEINHTSESLSYLAFGGASGLLSGSEMSLKSSDNGDAAFSIAGSPIVGQTLSIQQDASDPDGDGSFTHTWQSSSNGNTWNDIQTSDQLRLDQSLEGKNLRILTSYTDAQGFKETVQSDIVSIRNEQDSAPTTFAEYGSLTINHNWKKIELTGTYDNAVVIASDPTFFGGDPTTVRLRNIDSNSFEIRLQEPNYKDGNHTYETISFLVVEEGSWKLQDGTMISAGSKSTNKLSSSEHESVSFEADFTSLPALFTQVQTYNDADWVTTRTSNITQDSFSVAMQEEEKLNRGGHVTETIGWAAIDRGTANAGDIIIEGGITSDRFTHQTNSHQFINSFSTSPTLLTKLTTYDGSDTANSRITSLNSFGFGAIVQEEKSADNEINHTSESLSYLAFGGASGLLSGTYIV